MNRKFIIGVITVLVALSGALAYFKYYSEPPLPDPKEQKPEDIAKMISSPDFSKLSANAKGKYLENLGNQDKIREIFYSSQSMTDDQKKNLRENMQAVFELRMKKTADDYYALPKDKREEYLDKEIDKMAERMAERQRAAEAQGGTANTGGGGGFWNQSGGQGGGGPPGQGGRRQGPTAQQMKNRIETTDPATRAKTAQYRKELRERMRQRSN